MSKLELPSLTAVSAASVTTWINLCEDCFETWDAMNPGRDLKVKTKITLAGVKMEAPSAVTWWNENRTALKALTAWADFTSRVNEGFLQANWQLDALAKFFKIKQRSHSFQDFVASLEDAKNTLGGAGTGFVISDGVFKNHLLFCCHPVLSLRVRALPSLKYATTKPDALVAIMSSTWDSMVAEGVTAPRSLPVNSFASSSKPKVPSS
ncbi:hypothetical protein BDN72DRAFT_920983, partial [Pluteus cervinus]